MSAESSTPPHVQRVIDEKAQLDERHGKLITFISGGGLFDTLDPAEQARMRRQSEVMAEYSSILAERLAAAGY